jgi:autotransporter translocation and assembly factor TamB
MEKKLGKNLSIQYRTGIFNSLYIFNLKYKINKLFSIQSETSNQDNGADLLFEYEHD